MNPHHDVQWKLGDILLALGLGMLAFLFRLLAPDLTNDHFMHMAWAQQLLFGELPGRDFVDPGMPLTFGLSAAVQSFLPGPFGEVLLTAGMLGVAAAMTYAVTAALSGSRVTGVVAAVVEIALLPRLYNYPKILVPAMVLFALSGYARNRSTTRLVILAAVTTVAFLLRHDHGLYAALGAVTGLAVIHWTEWRRMATAVCVFAVSVAVLLLPYFMFLQWAGGISEHFREGVEFSRADEHQRFFEPPEFPFIEAGDISRWNRDDSAAFLFYAAHLLAILAIAVLVFRRRAQTREQRAVAAASIAILLSYIAVILRHPIAARVPDLATLLAITGTWALTEIARVVKANVKSHPARAFLLAAPATAVVVMGAVSIWTLGNITEQIDKTDMRRGVRKAGDNLADIAKTGTEWPWRDFWPTSGGMPAAVQYLNACTAPSDDVLITWNAPEYYFFSRRKFAAGIALFLPPRAFTTARDQQRMLFRLRRQRVPVVMINETRRDEFSRAYPLVDAFIKIYYEPAGHFTIYDQSEVTIAIRRDLQGAGSWGPEGWPCAFDSQRAHS